MAFTLCLNTSTVQKHKLPLTKLIDLAADAGYSAIEPWIFELDAIQSSGGSLRDVGKQASDRNLKIANLIGFAEWIVDEPDRRKKGLEEARRNFAQAAELGCPYVAAPPWGCHDRTGPSLDVIAERYADLLKVGRSFGVMPILEFWGFSKTLKTLPEAMYVLAKCGDPTAKLLVDPYHLYKGESAVAGVSHLNGASVGVVHMNDFPAISPEKITDADRVYPGEGIGKIAAFVKALETIGYDGVLSLELFNEAYCQQSTKDVLSTGLSKLKSVL